jgi:hypothetical protein
MENKDMKHQWRKSAHSSNGGANCVEVGQSKQEILIRDTKNRNGTVLKVPVKKWAEFLANIKLFSPQTDPLVFT